MPVAVIVVQCVMKHASIVPHSQRTPAHLKRVTNDFGSDARLNAGIWASCRRDSTLDVDGMGHTAVNTLARSPRECE